MEVVAAVSSVAGIAALVGQSLSGLNSLYNFFKDCREASKTADQFLRAVTSLESTIKEVESLVISVEGISDTSTEGVLASLAIHVEDCAKDVRRWLAEAKLCYPGGSGNKARFKRFLIAVKRQSIKDIFQEMAAHKDNISLSLATTGRLLDVQQLNKVDGLHGKVNEIAEYGKVTVEALGRLERRYDEYEVPRFYECETLHTSPSLGSIASQLSRIESLLSVGQGSTSSSVAPKDSKRSRLRRTGSTSSWYSTHSTSPMVTTGSRRNPLSPKSHRASIDVSQRGRSPSSLPPTPRESFVTDEISSEEEWDENHKCDYGWSCSGLRDHTSIFHQSAKNPLSAITCGFCGDEYPKLFALDKYSSFVLDVHAHSVHHFTECSQAEKWAEKHLFHEHLINTHAARIGSWTEKLEDVCYYATFSSSSKMEETTDAACKAEVNNSILSPLAACLEPGEDLAHSMTDSPPFMLFGQPRAEGKAVLDFFHAFDALIAQSDGSTSKNLTQYIRYSQIAETTRAHIRMLSALAPHLGTLESSIVKMQVRDIQEKTYDHLENIERNKYSYRQACWNEGYNVEEIDRILKTSERYEKEPDTSSENNQEPESARHMYWWDVLHRVGTQSWLTKKDRINFWLLQNLAAQPKQAFCHRKYLKDHGTDDQLSEEEWARVVLKFWMIDDAVRPSEGADCSTNGAVDSDGGCHSARVKLAST